MWSAPGQSGRHRAACPCSGRLRSRALAPERTIAGVCREAGATVRCNAKLREMNVDVAASDERAVEVLASGLPLYHEAQLAVDITSQPLSASGLPRFNAGVVDGAVCGRAREDKERKYGELLHGDWSGVVALEIGGRWSQEAVDFVAGLAAARAREATPLLRRSAFLEWRRRWSRMAISCARAFATSLTDLSHPLSPF